MKPMIFLLSAILCLQVTVFAHDAPQAKAAPSPKQGDMSTLMLDHIKGVFEGVKMMILGSAEKMPEQNFSFRPTETVRTFGQIIAHIADAQYYFASLATGEKNPGLKIEKTVTSKEGLIKALHEAFAYFDQAYQKMTPEIAVQTVKFMGGDTLKIGILDINNIHVISHYGNLVTYLRMNKIVPPSSELQPSQNSK